MSAATPLPHAEPPGDPSIEPAPAPGSVGRNATVLAAATIGARLATFVLAIAMGRRLGPQDYGLYGFAAAIGTIVAPIADLGLSPYVQREVARHGSAAAVTVQRGLLAKWVSSAVAMIAVAALTVPLQRDGRAAAVITLMVAATLADWLAQYTFAYFQGRERMGFQASVTIVTSLARGIVGAAIVIATGRLVPVIVWIAITSAGQCAWSLARLRREVPRTQSRPDGVGLEWRTVYAMGLISVFALIYLRADSVILGWVSTKREVGFYTSAYTIMAGIQIIPWMLAVALSPVFARTHAGDAEAFERTWQEGVRLVAIVALPLTLPVCLLAGGVMTLFYGGVFDPAATALAILIWSVPVWALNMVLAGVVRGAGHERWLAMTTGGGAVLNIAVNLWAIPRFGMNGAAAVTVATESVVLVALTWLTLGRRIVQVPRLPYLRLGLALVACSAVALALNSVNVLIALTLSGLAFAAVLAATGALDRRDLERLVRGLRR